MTNRCADVLGNDWSVLVPGADTMWTPRSTVSICIPTRNPGPGLGRTLNCLAVQTYPAHLMEVIVGDDGSDAPIEVPPDLPYPVRIVRQEHRLDFGAGQARNLAARAATGEILLFLDADVVPERQVVASYARWFEHCDLVMPMGLCRFVDVDDLGDEALVELVRTDTMAEHFATADVDDQDWRERHFIRTDDLCIEANDAFRVTIGATLAVAASQYAAVGGFPELGVRGVEDTAFGQRIHNDGGILILDRDAQHWHQGRRNLSDPGVRERINAIRAPYVESVMPVKGFRRGAPPVDPPVAVVPVARVRIHGDGEAGDGTRTSIERHADNGNVAVATAALGTASDGAFVQVELPAGVQWSASTVARIVELLDEHSVGVVKALVDGSDGDIVTIARTRAVRRAVHVRPDDDPIEVASELFGLWWTAASTLGLISPFSDEDTAERDDQDTPRTSRLYDGTIELLRRASS